MDTLFVSENLKEAVSRAFFLERIYLGGELALSGKTELDPDSKVYGFSTDKEGVITTKHSMADDATAFDQLEIIIPTIIISEIEDYVLHVVRFNNKIVGTLYSKKGIERFMVATFEQCEKRAKEIVDFRPDHPPTLLCKSDEIVSEDGKGFWHSFVPTGADFYKKMNREFLRSIDRATKVIKEATADVVWN